MNKEQREHRSAWGKKTRKARCSLDPCVQSQARFPRQEALSGSCAPFSPFSQSQPRPSVSFNKDLPPAPIHTARSIAINTYLTFHFQPRPLPFWLWNPYLP